MSYIPRLKKEYNNNVISRLIKEFSYDNVMQVPKLKKIVISKGVGAAVNDKKLIDHALNEISEISGQKAIATISKKDVASFKLRKGMPVGVKVTLRGERMYEFLDRFVTTALPRVRDFNGVKSTGFDGRGNYNLGITEQIIFPEINIDKINKISGMDITFVTNAKSDKEAMELLSELGLPFRKKSEEILKPKKIDKQTVIEELSDMTSVDETSIEDAPVDDAIVEEVSVDDTSVEEVSVEDAPVDEAIVEDAPVDEASVEDTPVDEASVEDTPVDEASVEDTPAEEENNK